MEFHFESAWLIFRFSWSRPKHGVWGVDGMKDSLQAAFAWSHKHQNLTNFLQCKPRALLSRQLPQHRTLQLKHGMWQDGGETGERVEIGFSGEPPQTLVSRLEVDPYWTPCLPIEWGPSHGFSMSSASLAKYWIGERSWALYYIVLLVCHDFFFKSEAAHAV